MSATEVAGFSKEILLNSSMILMLSSIAFGMAFSPKVRRQILERDGGKSVKSGETQNLEAAHIDHNRKNPRYNDQSNGRMLTRKEHYEDHYNRAGRNGLQKHHNDWALKSLWNRLTGKEREDLLSSGYPDPDGNRVDQYSFDI